MIYILSLILCTMWSVIIQLKRDSNNMIEKKERSVAFLTILLINISGFIVFGENFNYLKVLSITGTAIYFLVNFTIILIYPKISEKLLQKNIECCCILEKVYIFMAPVYGFFILELAYNTEFLGIRWQHRMVNIAVTFLIFLVLYNITIRKRLIMCVFYTAQLLIGLINGYVILFKDSPVMPNDLLVWRTALEVAGQYDFTPSFNMIFAIGTYMLLIGITVILVPKKEEWGKVKGKWISFGSIVVIISLFAKIDFSRNFYVAFNNWQPKESYYDYGFLLAFGSYAQKIKITPPEGYNVSDVEVILDNVSEELKEKQEKLPTIIAIMNESYSDLKVFKDFGCEPEYMPFWEKEHNFAMSGNLYVPTYAGGTANTEFEFLTGNSIVNVGWGIYPYQAYNFEKMPNVARTLKESGYHTVAIHPENALNWNRKKVYNQMGFDKFISLEDFENPVLVRDRVSDKSSYDKVIEEYEALNGPGFIFNVTMQNHGGYLYDVYPEEKLVQLPEELQQYTDLREYLTLMNESDIALEELLEYFENVDEPVIICFFGDHQPGLAYIFEKEGENSPELIERRYMTPYFIWTNYQQEDTIQADLSSNYLGALLLQQAGLAQDKQYQFLIEMWKNIPIYNGIAYKSSSGIWNENSEKIAEWISDYKMVQYYNMFDQ